ncbi:hypothetical protein AMTR_s00122p00097890, partial [Amborella trichopoda]
FIAGVLSKRNTITEVCSKELPMIFVTAMNCLGDECGLNDTTISTGWKDGELLYISMSGNLCAFAHSTFSFEPFAFFLGTTTRNQMDLEVAFSRGCTYEGQGRPKRENNEEEILIYVQTLV